MNPLIWMCLAASLASVSGIFLDPPAQRKTTARKQDSDDDDFMGGLKQFFGYTAADTNTGSHNKTAQESAESSGIYEELDTALEHATDSMDGLWQQFKKVRRGRKKGTSWLFFITAGLCIFYTEKIKT